MFCFFAFAAFRTMGLVVTALWACGLRCAGDGTGKADENAGGQDHRRSGSGDEHVVDRDGGSATLANDQAMLGDLTDGNETWACVKLIEQLQREPSDEGDAEVRFVCDNQPACLCP